MQKWREHGRCSLAGCATNGRVGYGIANGPFRHDRRNSVSKKVIFFSFLDAQSVEVQHVSEHGTRCGIGSMEGVRPAQLR